MRIIFIDEAGYCNNWRADLVNQPHYILSAVVFPLNEMRLIYEGIRQEIGDLNLRANYAQHPLGQGFEIKASDIVHGRGYWQRHLSERNAVRSIMLEAPKKHNGVTFAAVIDKKAHMNRYARPTNPYRLALQFVFERLQQYLTDIDDYGIVIYDQNKRIEDTLHTDATTLIRNGSELHYFSKIFGDFVTRRFRIFRILEFSMAQSQNSIGLQVADFFASFTCYYLKRARPTRCGWWKLLRSSFYRIGNRFHGIGYKEFP